MKIKIKRFDKSIPIPEYKTTGAACMDMYVRTNTSIAPNSYGYLPLNVAIEVPSDHWILLAARSSLHKRGLIPANGIGIIDSDYNGDSDEISLVVFNTTSEPVVIEKSTRVAQIMIVRLDRPEISEVTQLGNENRGGFGTTGNK